MASEKKKNAQMEFELDQQMKSKANGGVQEKLTNSGEFHQRDLRKKNEEKPESRKLVRISGIGSGGCSGGWSAPIILGHYLTR